MTDIFEMEPDREPDTPQVGRRRAARLSQRRRRRQRAIIFSVLAALVLCVVAATTWPKVKSTVAGVLRGEPRDYPGPGHGEVIFRIPEGASGTQIGKDLAAAGVIANAEVFISAFAASAEAISIQPGTYQLRQEMSANGALALLLSPEARLDVLINIPEGYRVSQVYQRLADELGRPLSEIEAAAGAIELPAAANGQIEGWIAPGQYPVAPDQDLREVFQEMVDRTKIILKEYNVADEDAARILTIGSIVEHEVNLDQYYRKTARVIYNRLSDASPTNGLLQMDSTVLYGVGQVGGIPTRAQLDTDTPYNTYLHPGLPPTPIGAVGEKALQAAVDPEPGDWVYFVTVNLDTGETKYAITLAEHEENVAELRAWQQANSDN